MHTAVVVILLHRTQAELPLSREAHVTRRRSEASSCRPPTAVLCSGGLEQPHRQAGIFLLHPRQTRKNLPEGNGDSGASLDSDLDARENRRKLRALVLVSVAQKWAWIVLGCNLGRGGLVGTPERAVRLMTARNVTTLGGILQYCPGSSVTRRSRYYCARSSGQGPLIGAAVM